MVLATDSSRIDMPNWNELDETLEKQGGVDGYLVLQVDGDASSAKHREDAGNCWKAFYRKLLYHHAAKVLLSIQSDAPQIEIQMTKTKVLAFVWDHYIFVVEVIRGHNVNKSIKRTVRRLQRKYDKPAVQSPSWKSSLPAVSSSAPKMGVSSPSLEVEPSMTGVSQVDPSNRVSPLSQEQNVNSGKKPESGSGTVPT